MPVHLARLPVTARAPREWHAGRRATSARLRRCCEPAAAEADAARAAEFAGLRARGSFGTRRRGPGPGRPGPSWPAHQPPVTRGTSQPAGPPRHWPNGHDAAAAPAGTGIWHPAPAARESAGTAAVSGFNLKARGGASSYRAPVACHTADGALKFRMTRLASRNLPVNLRVKRCSGHLY
jgi:hypothetical protein